MLSSLLYIILAILGLGVLVFIHELGHYIMARRVGMRVEAFAIGFGKPIFTWERNGVKWHICWLPFGGYVKIAGMQKEGNVEPSEIKDGFFGSRPIDRIKVAIMGPLVNIVFAFIAFTIIWATGGREKPFQEFTKRIGWMDTNSMLFNHGVRPGDEIVDLDGKPFKGFKDLMIASVMEEDSSRIRGFKINYFDHDKTPFDYRLSTYEDPRHPENKLYTVGIFSPASYLIYDRFSKGEENPLFPDSPLEKSGITYGDRIFWVDGELVFSINQLKALLSESTVFLTIERNGRVLHSKIPRVRIDDFHLTFSQKADLEDWRHEADLSDKKLDHLYFIPYVVSYDNVVQSQLSFIDERDQVKAFSQCTRCPFFNPLQKGDRILAIDGIKIGSSDALLDKLQTLHSLVIVQRDPEAIKEISWKIADQDFDKTFSSQNLEDLIASIGTDMPMQTAGHLHLLQTIEPKSIDAFAPSNRKNEVLQFFAEREKAVRKMDSGDRKTELLKALEMEKKQPYLGINLQDREVRFNPNPIALFGSVFDETWRTLYKLVTGYINPKWLSGPVGIVHVVHQSWSVGVKEALFWMGVISLNLGFLNLLPIPVLDGGHICFSLLEMVTKKPLKAKTMERLIIPFVVLLIGMIIFVTYHDLARLFSRFF